MWSIRGAIVFYGDSYPPLRAPRFLKTEGGFLKRLEIQRLAPRERNRADENTGVTSGGAGL